MSRRIIGLHCPPVPDLTEGLPVRLMVVLVESGGRFQVAYQAIVRVPLDLDGALTNMNASLVADRGSKLSYEEAQRHFPSLKRKTYS